MAAATTNQREAVVLLLQAGADPSLRDHRGRTARDRALLEGHTALADLLGRH
jgi:ankyrin repeat protein